MNKIILDDYILNQVNLNLKVFIFYCYYFFNFSYLFLPEINKSN